MMIDQQEGVNMERYFINKKVIRFLGISLIAVLAVVLISLFLDNAEADPALSWTGERGFIGDGVHPQTGLVNGTFDFRILYRDGDNMTPDYVSLFLRPTGGAWTNHSLTSVANDNFYTRGVIFSKQISLSTAGSYQYYFISGYNNTEEVRMPSSSGVYMEEPLLNTPPVLQGGIDKEYGIESSTFRYTATFYDADNNPVDPKHGFLFIDGTSYPMLESDMGDNDTVDGKEYYYEMDMLDIGVHEFYFQFKDSFGTMAETNLTFLPKIYDGWPDLLVRSQDISFHKDPGTGNLQINATVHNIGMGSAYDIPVVIWMNDPDDTLGEIPVPNNYGNHSYHISYLPKNQGESFVWLTDIVYNDTQYNTVYVTVDMDYREDSNPYHPFAEAKPMGDDMPELVDYSDPDTNNKAYNIYSFGPDIEIRKSEVLPVSVILGRKVTFIATIRNVGNDIVPLGSEVMVNFTLISPDGNEMDAGTKTYSIWGGMMPGAPFQAEMQHEFGSGLENRGQWRLIVNATVNATQGVELNLINNIVDVPLDVVRVDREAVTPSFNPSIVVMVLGILVCSHLLIIIQKRRR